MFTGIIQAVGSVVDVKREGDWVFTLRAPEICFDLRDGASVACNGACLTVISLTKETFEVQASSETLARTTLGAWDEGTKVNLERALRMGDELGGHIVTGHVDGVARVVSRAPERESERFVFEVPEPFARFIASKGSIALDGVSLTVNEVEGTHFGVNIIPYTQHHTTLGVLQEGAALNFEIDPLARYVARLQEAS